MKRKHIIYLHIILWFYLLYPEFIPHFFYPDKIDREYYLGLPLNIALDFMNFYVFYLFILPWIMNFKNKVKTVLIGLGMVIVFTAFRYICYYIFNITILHESHEEIMKVFFWASTIIQQIRASLVFALYAVFISFILAWYAAQKQKAELINQNQASELALLRSQINPHFLFNTLNNIYSLVYKKSDNAPEAVMKLSSIMRYMLYDSSEDKVLLEKEVEYLKSFIELQELRLMNKNFVSFDIHGSLQGRTISPMILMPFIENAFKHGNKQVKSPGIMVDLALKEQLIIFKVSNYLAKSPTEKDEAGGIGVHNINRRLELIYPDKHRLEIKKTPDMFHIILEIDN
jgi:two-component system LytT family sensor kinase